MATWSLETQLFRSQRILKPSTSSDEFLSKILMRKKHHIIGVWCSHSVFGSPATQVPENPKAEHPTPKVTSAVFGALVGSLDRESPRPTKATSEVLTVKLTKRHTRCVRGKILQRAFNLGPATQFGSVP